MCKFDAETHYSLALQALCHRSAALHLPLVGDTTAESPERKTGSKALGADNASYWFPFLAEVTSCLISFYNELSSHVDNVRAVDVIYL